MAGEEGDVVVVVDKADDCASSEVPEETPVDEGKAVEIDRHVSDPASREKRREEDVDVSGDQQTCACARASSSLPRLRRRHRRHLVQKHEDTSSSSSDLLTTSTAPYRQGVAGD